MEHNSTNSGEPPIQQKNSEALPHELNAKEASSPTDANLADVAPAPNHTSLDDLAALLLFPDEDENEEDETEEQEELFSDNYPLILSVGEDETDDEDEEEEPAVNPAPELPVIAGDPFSPQRFRKHPLAKIGRRIKANVPRKKDSAAERVRKILFWLFAAVLVVWLTYILCVSFFQPAIKAQQSVTMTREFFSGSGTQENPTLLSTMTSPSFDLLTKRNPDTAGWLQFHAAAATDFLAIDSPVMYSGDNHKYVRTNVAGRSAAGGSLFFDGRCHVTTAREDDRVRIIYGSSAAAGGRMAELHQLVGSVYYARAATEFSVSTPFDTNRYQVFAVLLTDEEAASAYYFNTRRMVFSSQDDFLCYVSAVRARSLFDYPVEVSGDDSLLVITTDAPASVSKLRNGRITVFARRMTGEESWADPLFIVKNTDVIMPYAWYTQQHLTPHPYYTSRTSTEV